ncbi:hypothetical protein C2L64_50395 [Paraburkholderia hospita]|uniref:Uncharacterized protein n=2 Tax=Paraburkholderia hospita TaxID=169430 RepID=A0AAN1JMF1_9BURK|nr:hypothetical protein C2L64_50395 [Paraburkholderia hospita]OUL80757.1 hypothetical protein CA603_31350 [Paraburkholderia hospita]
MEDATRRYMPIVVEFDPDFILVSMEMWRKSLDMQIPISDEFKIHFMENRRRLLEGFVITGKAWKIIVRDLKAVDEPAVLEDVRLAVQSFLSWAEDGLKALDDLTPNCC